MSWGGTGIKMNMPCLFGKLATERGQGPCAPKGQGRVPKCSPGSKWDSDTSLQTPQHHKELQRTSSASALNKTPVLPMTEPLVETWEFNSDLDKCFPLPQKQPSLRKSCGLQESRILQGFLPYKLRKSPKAGSCELYQKPTQPWAQGRTYSAFFFHNAHLYIKN